MKLTKAQQREWERRCLEFDRAMMRKWSDAQLCDAIASIEAGNHDGTRFWRAGYPLPATIQAAAEEAARRGLLRGERPPEPRGG